MKKFSLVVLLIFFILLGVKNVNAFDPVSGSTNVGGQVGSASPTESPTPTISGSPTPTNIPTATLTPTVTPTLAPGVSATPTPSGGPTNSPTPTLTSKDIYINISGLASPNATIVVTSKDIFLTSLVASSEGFFSMKQIKVDQQNGTVCFDTTDFKRLGSSYVCLPIPNTKEKFTNDSVFLPPTMGLSARRITQGGSTYAFGYTMPNSNIATHISANKTIQSQANDSGFYKVQVKNLPVGTYYLFATAKFEKQDSEKTDKPLELQSLTPEGLVVEETKDGLGKIFPWFILIALIILILFIILLFNKKFRKRVQEVLHLENKSQMSTKVYFAGSKKLHHDWML